MIDNKQLRGIQERWDNTKQGYMELSFEQAHADMMTLLQAVMEQDSLHARIAELEAHVRKRNGDMQAFVTEVSKLANQKYADWVAAK